MNRPKIWKSRRWMIIDLILSLIALLGFAGYARRQENKYSF